MQAGRPAGGDRGTGRWAAGSRLRTSGPRLRTTGPRLRPTGLGRVVVLLSVAVLVVAACATAPPTLIRTPAPASLAPGWITADVEQPASLVNGPSTAPGQFCSPCHGASATLMLAVAHTVFGFIAVGYEQPGPHAAVWTSPDARRWTRVTGFPAVEGSAAFAVAADEGRIVVVGSDRSGAVSWASTDGRTWSLAPAGPALAGPAAATAMVAVVAFGDGFVAAGRSDDPAAGRTAAAVWLSADGLTWQRIVAGDAFAGARVVGLAASGGRLVAVGTAGPEQAPSLAWTSSDGRTWTRVADPALAGGVVRAVAAGGPGFVAVGAAAADDRALAWTSPDGATWAAVPDGPAFENGGAAIRMLGVSGSPGGLAAVGWRSDAGNGSAVAWSSSGGRDWRRSPQATSFSGGEMDGVAASGQLTVAVGLTGYPDNDAARVWLNPG